MVGDLNLAGFRFTREEWSDLDDDDRVALLRALIVDDAGVLAGEPYESYEIEIAPAS